ncbi:hypothetical protein F5Y06DRAFT_303186 [Hypoxylon sp. FL0890]|nr:hypothetical protein F5Y06DRAFT_303186 [Hypoxylon sp. FL0890]
MEAQELEVHEEDNIVTLTINPENPPTWVRVGWTIKPFIQCRSKCFGHATTYHSGSLTQLSGGLQSLDLAQSEHPANKPSTPLLSLPVDIFYKIFEAMAPPYELEANLCCEAGDPLLLILPSPRTWKSMKVFHISKIFRERAIHFYGQPSETSLPFNSRMDKLVITDMLPLSDVNKLLNLKTQRDSARRDIYREQPQMVRNGVYCYNMTVHSPSPHVIVNPPTIQTCPEFFDLVKRVDFTTLSKPLSYYGRADDRIWGRVFHWLSGMFQKIDTISVSTPQFDNCCAKDEDGGAPERLFRSRDTWFLSGFQEAFFERVIFGRIPERLFPALRWIEVVRLEPMCSAVAYLEGHPGDVDTDHFLFDTGEGGWGSFYRSRIEGPDMSEVNAE